VLAKLLGASPGSIYNWEHGTKPNAKFLVDLRRLAREATDGKVAAPAARVGRAPRAAAATPASTGRRGRPPAIHGDAAPLYANRVVIQQEGGEARIRFGWIVPGASGARAVADIVVPRDVLARLRS
jgi:hypothetical protein